MIKIKLNNPLIPPEDDTQAEHFSASDAEVKFIV